VLALSDEALARLVIGATRVPDARAGWLRRIAQRVDPPTYPPWRQRQLNGAAIYWLTGRLTESRSPRSCLRRARDRDRQRERKRDLINVRFGPLCGLTADIPEGREVPLADVLVPEGIPSV
jgi:hypothetical protein